MTKRYDRGEAELVHRLRRGDEDAMEQLIDTFGDKLLRTARGLLGDHQWAEDVVQETFVAAFQGIRRFRGQSTLYTWLYAIVVNKCRMHLRKKHPILLEEPPHPEHTHDDVGQIVVGNEDRQRFMEALAALPYVYREALVLHYYVDMSVADIAHVLQCPAGTVKSRLHRARRMMATMLAEVKHRAAT